jgi:hypothetical protein
MRFELGPVLCFHGCDAGEWRLSALVVAFGDPGTLIHSGDRSVAPQSLWTVDSRTAFAFRFSVPLQVAESRFTYTIGGQTYEVALPARETVPRLAYSSCNGTWSLKRQAGKKDRNALWRRMAKMHGEKPFHLLLQGGDQVYADGVIAKIPELKEWAELAPDAADCADFTPKMERNLERFYFGIYVDNWALPEIAHMLARVPMMAMWDDHDIIDGWGSYPASRQLCPMFKGLGRVAYAAFGVFQQQIASGEARPGAIAPHEGFSYGHVAGPLAVLAMDLRSQRSDQQIMTPEHWTKISAWIAELRGVAHLLVMSSIPVVYPNFRMLEVLLGIIPGHQELEHDLRDHWHSTHHEDERAQLLAKLLNLVRWAGIRPTLISGDVHVGALGVIEDDTKTPLIYQLISSGIVNANPPGIVQFALRRLFRISHNRAVPDADTRMIEFPGTDEILVGNRNFLTLMPNGDAIHARWVVEDDARDYLQVIAALR